MSEGVGATGKPPQSAYDDQSIKNNVVYYKSKDIIDKFTNCNFILNYTRGIIMDGTERKSGKNCYQCDIISSYVSMESAGMVRTYGLHLYNTRPNLTANEEEACTIEDITDSYDKIVLLRQYIYELGVEPVHLREIVEDFLS